MITLQERVHSAATPAHWSINKLHHVFRVRKGQKNTGMQEENLLSLSYGRIIPKDIDTAEGLLPESFETYQIVEPGNIVMRLTDLQNDKRSLRQGLVKERGIITTAYDALEVGKDHSSRFWSYALLALDLAKYYYSLGGGVRQSIKFADFPNDWVATPDLETQKAIADFLDRETARIDQLIEKKQRLVEVLDEKGLTSSCGLADGSIIGASASNHRTWFGTLPDGWKTRRAKFLYRESNRRSISGEEELLTVSHITGVTPRSEKQVYMFEAESNEGYKLVAPRDLAINTMWAWMGAMGVSRHEGLVSPSYGVYSPTTCELLPDYMDVLVRTRQFVAEATRRSKGIHSSRLRLYPDAFLDMPLPVPPKHVQEQMLAALRSAVGRTDDLKRVIGGSIERLHEFRSALITAAVTGQIDVATWGKHGTIDQRLDKIEEEMRA